MSQRVALITGVTGQDGSYLAELLPTRFIILARRATSRSVSRCPNTQRMATKSAPPRNFPSFGLCSPFGEQGAQTSHPDRGADWNLSEWGWHRQAGWRLRALI